MVVHLTHAMMAGPTRNRKALLNLMMTLKSGVCNGVRVRLGRLQDLIRTSCIESLDFLISPEPTNSIALATAEMAAMSMGGTTAQ
jgi:hypothetical protein